MTQAALAERCALTGSYISLLESARKPAPSDRVVRKLAAALRVEEDEALRVAHLDRAPPELRSTVERLRREAAMERTLRERTAETLFPLSLWGLDPGGLPGLAGRPGGRRNPSVGEGIIETISRLLALAGSSPDLPSYQRKSRDLLRSLPVLQRRRLLDAAPRILREAGVAGGVFEVEAPPSGAPPEVRPGDTLRVDPRLPPREGDLVLVGTGGDAAVVPWASGGAAPRGVVVEVRRRLRR